MNYSAVFLATAMMFGTIATSRSQSLADLAKKEKERREQIKSDVKVLTNSDSSKYRGGAVTTVTLPAAPARKPAQEKETAAPPAGGGIKAEADEPVDLQGRPESWWRQTFSDARKKIRDLENEANVLTLRLNDLQNQFYRESSGFKQQEIQRDIQKTSFEQDRNKEDLTKAKAALQDLENESRKSGALPGWRDSKTP